MTGKQSKKVAKAQQCFMDLRGKGFLCRDISIANIALMFGLHRTTIYKAQWYKDEIELDRKEGK